jgi:hypothetical protein
VLIDEWSESIVHWYKYLGACHGIVLRVYPTGYLKSASEAGDALFVPIRNIARFFGMQHILQ